MRTLRNQVVKPGQVLRVDAGGYGFAIIAQPSHYLGEANLGVPLPGAFQHAPFQAYPLLVRVEAATGTKTLDIDGPRGVVLGKPFVRLYLDRSTDPWFGSDGIASTLAVYTVWVFEDPGDLIAMRDGTYGGRGFGWTDPFVQYQGQSNPPIGLYSSDNGYGEPGIDISNVRNWRPIVKATAGNLTGGAARVWLYSPTVKAWAVNPSIPQWPIGTTGQPVEAFSGFDVDVPLGRAYVELLNPTASVASQFSLTYEVFS